MQLTERQCWKVIRQLVKGKNKEYKSLLYGLFGKNTEKTKQIQGRTRDAFLHRYSIRTLGDFFAEYREQTKSEPDTSDWIDNLDSESLLLFLDFRCRVLQQIYDYFGHYNAIDQDTIYQIIDGTKLSKLAKFKVNSKNEPAIAYSRKPDRAAGGEKKLKELNMTVDELSEQALAQTMGKLVGGYMDTQKVSFDHAIRFTTTLTTYNTKPAGEKTGYVYKGEVEIIPQKPIQEPKKEQSTQTTTQKIRKNEDMEFIGFDGGGLPLYIKDGIKVNLLGIPTSVKIVYDVGYNELINITEEEYLDQLLHNEVDLQSRDFVI